MYKTDKYLLFQSLDNIIQAEDVMDDPKDVLDSVMYDLKRIRKMVEDF